MELSFHVDNWRGSFLFFSRSLFRSFAFHIVFYNVIKPIYLLSPHFNNKVKLYFYILPFDFQLVSIDANQKLKNKQRNKKKKKKRKTKKNLVINISFEKQIITTDRIKLSMALSWCSLIKIFCVINSKKKYKNNK